VAKMFLYSLVQKIKAISAYREKTSLFPGEDYKGNFS
jgi:hypothetical protein